MFFGGTSMYFPSLFIICFDGINNEGVDGFKKNTGGWVSLRMGLGGSGWRPVEGSGLPRKGWVFGL